MSNSATLVFLLVAGALTPGAALGQGAMELAIAGPQPHFVAAWAPKKEREAERSAVLAGRVSLQLRNVSLDAALKALTNQAGLRITYSRAMLPAGKRVTISASDVAVVTAMTEMLFRSGLDVVVDRDGALALVVCRHPAREAEVQDSGAIVGRVTDKGTGAPLFGATVVAQGTRLSATTKNNGEYMLRNVPNGTYTIGARYIGYAALSTSVTVRAGEDVKADFALEKSVQKLDEIVTTGTLLPTEVKALPTPVSVVTGEEITERNFLRVDQIFRGMVPGALAWDPGVNADYYAILPSFRGRTSLAANPPGVKTYVDGIEVANPWYIATIDPDGVERVEVMRGPEGSTVYGSDASGGVIQIFTRKGTQTSRPELSASALVGYAEGPFADGTPMRHDYSLNLRGGGPSFSYALGGSFLYVGAVAPGFSSRLPTLHGGASLTQGATKVEFSARYAAKNWSPVFSPLLGQYGSFFSTPTYEQQTLPQQTFGITTTYQASSRWQHRLVLGYDGTTFGSASTQPRLTNPGDTLLTVWSELMSKSSVRYHTSYAASLTAGVALTAIGGAEYYRYRQDYYYTASAPAATGSVGNASLLRNPYSNSGYFTQVQMGLFDRMFLTAGVRAERNDNFGDAYGTAWSPRVGVSYVQSLGATSWKLRGSYGNAIRGVLPAQKQTVLNTFTNQIANSQLAPERQSGWDAGVDLFMGSRISVGVTYYNQDAKDIIQQVLLRTDTFPPVSQYQNAARISNRGWEFEASIDLGEIALSGTFAPVSSRVRRLSPTYTGDLRVGDRVLGVPRSSGGLSFRWTPSQGSTGILGITHLAPWTNTDWVSLYGAFFGGQPYRGSGRDYWIRYPAITKVNVSLAQRLTTQLLAVLQVDNIGNNQRFENDNTIIPVGRVTSLGLRVTY